MSTTAPQSPNHVHGYEKRYPIRKHRNVYRYRVTAPVDLLDEAGIEEYDQVGVSATVSDDGHLVIVYSTNLSEDTFSLAACKHSSGEFTVPSAFAVALDLEGEYVEYELHEFDDHYEVRAKTDVRLPDMTSLTGMADLISTKPIEHVAREVTETDDSGEEKSWHQEHFQVYLNKSQTETLGWADGQDIALRIVQAGGRPALLFSTETEDANPKTVKEVKRTGDLQDDRTLYVPNDVMKTLGLVDKELAWQAVDGELLTVPM